MGIEDKCVWPLAFLNASSNFLGAQSKVRKYDDETPRRQH
jgi:hypothetical protein